VSDPRLYSSRTAGNDEDACAQGEDKSDDGVSSGALTMRKAGNRSKHGASESDGKQQAGLGCKDNQPN
jgi:hypothetical protein